MALLTYYGILDLFKKGAIAEAQEQFTALHESALRLKQQNRPRPKLVCASETGVKCRWQLESNGITYYRVENGKRDGPYCQRCHDTESRLKRLQALDAATYVCLTCKMEFERNLCG